MATVSVVNTYRAQGDVAVLYPTPIAKETLTSSGTNAVSTSVALASSFWAITPLGNVWVKFGTAPVASAGNDFLCPAGITSLFAGVAGHKVAVIDAT